MDIPVLPGTDADVEEAKVVEDHPGFIPPDGRWICRCGTGNKADAVRCVDTKCGHMLRDHFYQWRDTDDRRYE